MLAREDTEKRIHPSKTKTEHFWPAIRENFYIEKLYHSLETTSRQKVAPGYVKCPRSHWQ
jgi:hypothetical protein